MTRVPRLLLLLALLLAPRPATSGPWGSGEGHLYLKLTAGMLATDELATPDGTIHEIPEFRRRDLSFYAAYGLTDRITLLGQLPVHRWSELEDYDEASGVGDLELGASFELHRDGPFALAAIGNVQAPTGDETAGDGLLPTGSGVWEGEARLSGGVLFPRERGLAFLEAGYQVRAGGLKDAIVAEGHVEGRLAGRLALGLHLSAVKPLGSERAAAGSAAGLGDGVQYLAYGPTLALDLPRGFGLHLELEDTTWVKNVATGWTARVGVSFRR